MKNAGAFFSKLGLEPIAAVPPAVAESVRVNLDLAVPKAAKPKGKLKSAAKDIGPTLIGTSSFEARAGHFLAERPMRCMRNLIGLSA